MIVLGYVLVGVAWLFVACVVASFAGRALGGPRDYDMFGLPIPEPRSNVRPVDPSLLGSYREPRYEPRLNADTPYPYDEPGTAQPTGMEGF